MNYDPTQEPRNLFRELVTDAELRLGKKDPRPQVGEQGCYLIEPLNLYVSFKVESENEVRIIGTRHLPASLLGEMTVKEYHEVHTWSQIMYEFMYQISMNLVWNGFF